MKAEFNQNHRGIDFSTPHPDTIINNIIMMVDRHSGDLYVIIKDNACNVKQAKALTCK